MEIPKKINDKFSKLEDGKVRRRYMRPYALVLELVILNIGLIVGGYYADAYLQTSPIMILTATFISIGGTIWLLLKTLKMK